MTSQDVPSSNNNYVTVELLNAHMARLEAIMERNLALTRADIADLKSDMANFKAEIKQDIASVRAEIKEVDNRLQMQIAQVDSKIEVQNAKIDGLVHWNYWIIAVLVVIFIMPHVIEGFKAFCKSLTEGMISLFARKSKN